MILYITLHKLMGLNSVIFWGDLTLGNKTDKCFIEVTRHHTIIKCIHNTIYHIRAYYIPIFLIEYRRYTVGAWSFCGVHLFESSPHFLCIEFSQQLLIHLGGNLGIDCNQTSFKIGRMIRLENGLKVLQNYTFNPSLVLLPHPIRILYTHNSVSSAPLTCSNMKKLHVSVPPFDLECSRPLIPHDFLPCQSLIDLLFQISDLLNILMSTFSGF